MRALLLLFLTLPTLAFALDKPVPVSAEAPVAHAGIGVAAGVQTSPFVASNGEIALAVWQDPRSGGSEVYAARIDRTGMVLDPRGIRIAEDLAVEAVVWNGSHFAVVMHWNAVRHVVAFVAPGGQIAGQRDIPLGTSYRFIDASDQGNGVRLLFLQRGFDLRAAIVTGEGDLVADVALPAPFENHRDTGIAAGSGMGEFLIVRRTEHKLTSRIVATMATRLAFDGTVLSTVDANTTARIDEHSAIEGGPAGYILVTQNWAAPSVNLYRLDRNGVSTRFEQTILAEDPADRKMFDFYTPRIVREGDRFLVAWHTSLQNGHSYTYAAEVPADGNGTTRQIWDWAGITHGLGLTSFGGHRVVVVTAHAIGAAGADVFAHTFTPGLNPVPPMVVSHSATRETGVAVAVGANGFLVAWREEGHDGLFHFYVRRVSPSGEPLEEPRKLHTGAHPVPVWMASTGRAYLVAWSSTSGVMAQRMSAFTGEWRDAEPFAIAMDHEEVTFGSNGTDVLMAWNAPDPDANATTLYARRIRLIGDPLRDEPVLLMSVPEQETQAPHDLALASNGSDYLLAWSTGMRNCWTLCIVPPYEIQAMRLRADATKLDAMPLSLTPGANDYPKFPSVAWNGGRYVVAWANGTSVRGATVTAMGAVLDRDVTLVRPVRERENRPKLVAHGDDFVLFTRITDGSAYLAATWWATAFGATDDLASVADRPRVIVSRAPGYPFGSLDAVSNGTSLLVGYDRVAGPEAGGVPRVFVRLFDVAPVEMRRRAVR